MEIRVYYSKDAVEAAIKDKFKLIDNLELKWEEHSGLRVDGPGGMIARYNLRESDCKTMAYARLRNLVEEAEDVCKGVDVLKVTLHDTLAIEQNPHIQQGVWKGGKSSFQVSYGIEHFWAPTAATGGINPDGFRGVIEIRMRGKSLQSITTCYSKIRQGDYGGNWKGEPATPVVTGVPEDLGLEVQN